MRRTLALVVLLASCNLLPSSPQDPSVAGNGAGEAGTGGERAAPEPFPADLESALPVFAMTMKQGPAAMEQRDFELFWLAKDGNVRHLTRDRSGFHETQLDESRMVRPVALSRSDGQMEAFIASPEGGVVIRSFAKGEWQPERELLGGPILSSISVASYVFDELDLFGVAESGTLHHARLRPEVDKSFDWTELPGIKVSGDVGVVARLQDELRLFARTADGELWIKVLSPAQQIDKDWHRHPFCKPICPCHELRDPPIVASQDGSRIDLVFVSQDDSVWHLAANMGSYENWTCTELKAEATSSAHLKMNAHGLPTLFRISGESVLASDWTATEPNFEDWRRLSFAVSDLATAGTSRTFTHLFGRSPEGAIQYRVWETE